MRRSINFRTIAPYALLLPGLLWLAVFYVYPAFQMFLVSLWTGNIQDGFTQTWNWGIYPEAMTEYWPWIARSIVYGGLATILAFALGFPLAYAIAFRGGQYKNLLLFLVIAPFFTSFLLRTISWKIILADDGHRPRPAQGGRRSCRRSSDSSRRRPPSSPVSPTTSCRS